MYTFEDKGGESMSLRPEGTAGCVRAALDKTNAKIIKNMLKSNN